MRKVNWPVAAPLLLMGVLLGGLAVWRIVRFSGEVPAWSLLGLPVLLVTVGYIAVESTLRRRKSRRTWDLMLREDPNSNHFMAFVYPPVKTQLRKLGWRTHGTAYSAVPAIGVSISPTSLMFWEAGVSGPTLTLTASDFESAALGSVSDGYRGHPAIELRLNTADRNNRLELNLRNAQHQNLSLPEVNDALEMFRVMKAPTGPKPLDG